MPLKDPSNPNMQSRLGHVADVILHWEGVIDMEAACEKMENNDYDGLPEPLRPKASLGSGRFCYR